MSRAAFMTGVQHAADLIVEARAIQTAVSCESSIEMQFREGAPQVNMVEPYLRRLLAEPDMLEGFAAVLSDYLSMDVPTEPDYYRDLTEAEIFGDQS